jgi:hypothetical protein
MLQSYNKACQHSVILLFHLRRKILVGLKYLLNHNTTYELLACQVRTFSL